MRPERFELPAFWFVARQESAYKNHISFAWRRLRTSLPSFNCTQRCTQVRTSVTMFATFF